MKVKKFPEKYYSFKVENNILSKHIFPKYPLDRNVFDGKIVIPNKNQLEVLQKFYYYETAGHLGLSKTLARISELYYWANMRKSDMRYIRKCFVCAASKSSNLPQAGLMGNYRNINSQFQLISADLIGLYLRSKSGNQYVLVVVDWFTKYVLVHPMGKATSNAIVKFIENQVFLVFGVCQIFACDNGSQFVSKDFKELMKI